MLGISWAEVWGRFTLEMSSRICGALAVALAATLTAAIAVSSVHVVVVCLLQWWFVHACTGGFWALREESSAVPVWDLGERA